MSVYIPGMEMPKSCYDCPFGEDVDVGVGVAHGCNLLKDFAQFADERHKDCPLVPVPDHGDLIDRDALRTTTSYGKNRLGYSTHETFYALRDVKNAPTVIPADFAKDINAPSKTADGEAGEC